MGFSKEKCSSISKREILLEQFSYLSLLSFTGCLAAEEALSGSNKASTDVKFL